MNKGEDLSKMACSSAARANNSGDKGQLWVVNEMVHSK